jgi:magnesium-transporting ATPase (P-type)
MKGTPAQPGILAGSGAWSVEVGSSHVALDKDTLEDKDGKWRVKENVEDPLLRGQDVVVTFTLFQVSLFFSIYVFFQVWNQINCRSLTPETSGFHRILSNPTFLAIGTAVAVGQIVIVTFGGTVFNVEPLGPLAWLGIVAFTSTVLIFAEIARRLRLRARKRFTAS